MQRSVGRILWRLQARSLRFGIETEVSVLGAKKKQKGFRVWGEGLGSRNPGVWIQDYGLFDCCCNRPEQLVGGWL